MTRRLVHVLLLVLLVSSTTVRAVTGDVLRRPVDLEAAAAAIATAHGLLPRGATTPAESLVSGQAFEAPGCAGPILLVPLHTSFEEGQLIDRIGPPENRRSFVYADRRWAAPDPGAVFRSRLRIAALATLRLTDLAPSWRLLMVSAPPGCEALEGIDWSPAWRQ